MSRRLRAAALVCVAAGLLAACGISDDAAPRDIPVAEQLPLGGGLGNQAGASAGTSRVYLLAPEVAGQATVLQGVPRDVDETPEAFLKALFAGPNAGELDEQYRTALPGEMVLLSTSRRGSVLEIDVSKDLQLLSGQALVAAVAQIVFTCSELPGVASVKILVEGADQQWPTGNGEVQSEPLTVYDYPGLVQSAQPAYPAIPTPSQP